jgi:hypothetical protein
MEQSDCLLEVVNMKNNENLLLTIVQEKSCFDYWISICLKFEIRDLWIGVYWIIGFNTEDKYYVSIYICFVPCFPIRITLVKKINF